MQFTLHATRRTPHGASRLVQAMSAWLVKTRRAPSRHSRDARVYGHTTTAINKLSAPPPQKKNAAIAPISTFKFATQETQNIPLCATHVRSSMYIQRFRSEVLLPRASRKHRTAFAGSPGQFAAPRATSQGLQLVWEAPFAAKAPCNEQEQIYGLSYDSI